MSWMCEGPDYGTRCDWCASDAHDSADCYYAPENDPAGWDDPDQHAREETK